jgi:sulfur carrier protein ThiS
MAVAINGEIIPDALYEDIPDGAEVHFIPAIAGG